jgi:hypothetical protein
MPSSPTASAAIATSGVSFERRKRSCNRPGDAHGQFLIAAATRAVGDDDAVTRPQPGRHLRHVT